MGVLMWQEQRGHKLGMFVLVEHGNGTERNLESGGLRGAYAGKMLIRWFHAV